MVLILTRFFDSVLTLIFDIFFDIISTFNIFFSIFKDIIFDTMVFDVLLNNFIGHNFDILFDVSFLDTIFEISLLKYK